MASYMDLLHGVDIGYMSLEPSLQLIVLVVSSIFVFSSLISGNNRYATRFYDTFESPSQYTCDVWVVIVGA